MSSRSKARELALKALYALESTEQDPGEVFESVAQSAKLNEDGVAYARRLFDSTSSSVSDLDSRISKLAHNWRIERLATVDKNILRLSMTELLHFPDIPRNVSIDEAIELAKKYGAAESPAFVNGVLDRFASELK